ncbi:hypothetical protein DNTS_029847 [Danionella cerebrum]|uniref:SAP domain-containing protein n=1 Tax=Danionella cerebrum TaxID=2873325 RepID=A0A553NLY7_9TELE|nr:hypothetical protein DNTS_029847 [Danionella translucida]
MAEVVELHKLKLAELKQECTARGLDAKGTKGELIARLQAYLEEHEEVNEEEVLGGYGEETSSKDENADHKEEFASDETEPEKKLVKLNPAAASGERLQKRAERFNVPLNADNKKAARAARFGTTGTEPSKAQKILFRFLLADSWLEEVMIVVMSCSGIKFNPVDLSQVSVEVLKKRAERFGMNVSSVSKKVEDDEKLKKRKERFGIITNSSTAGAEDSEAKKRKRAERFGNV